MLKLVLIASVAAYASAMIYCPKNYCDGVDCQALTACNGRVKQGGSACGCCDVCMTQLGEGENCMQTMLLGIPPTVECGQGLTCDRATAMCKRTVSIQARADSTDAPCTRRLKEIRLSQQNGLPLLGVTEPKCDADGNYAAVQCFGSVCSCVDNMGMEIQNYQGSIGDLANMNCQCARDQAAYMKTGLIGKLFFCDTNGNYKAGQAPQTTAKPMVSGSQTGLLSGSQTGTGGVFTGSQVITGACAKELAGVQGGLLGAFVPECDADGMYTPRQCMGSECYCVRKDGTKIDGYSSPIAQKDHTTCQCARDKDSFQAMGLLGRIHTCRANGNYQQYQCMGSVCYCTDDMGARIGTNSVNIGNINDLKC